MSIVRRLRKRVLTLALVGMLGTSGVIARAQMPPASAGAPTAPATIPANKPVALVNGEAIPYSELEPLLKQIGPLPVAISTEQRREMQREALAMLIDDLLLQQYVQKYVPKADQAEVQRKLAELEASQKEKGKTLADFYKETNQTPEQLLRTVNRLVQWAMYAKTRVTEADLQKYYNDYKPFFDRVVVRASHIALRVPTNATPAQKQALVKKLKDLRAEIVAGKIEFAEAAKKHSQCPTAPSGGDVGSFPRKFVVEEPFARAAFALQVNEISDVVETDYGLHLIRVTERKAGEPSNYEKIKDDVKEFYIEDMQQNILREQRKAAKIEILLP